MLTKQQISDYLRRIGVSAPIENTMVQLDKLQLAHLQSVPFENLDIGLGNEILLNKFDIFNKVIYQKRGGFCYELNYCFYLLLVSLGFNVSLISGRVFNGSQYGEEFDHLLLLVELDDKRVIADVGFGDSSLKTVMLNGTVSHDCYARYRITQDNADYYLQKSDLTEGWQPQYKFTLTARRLNDFSDMARYHQSAPESPFTQRSTCTIATPEGRLTISNHKLIKTQNNVKSEQVIKTANQYCTKLDTLFGITLTDGHALFNKIFIKKD